MFVSIHIPKTAGTTLGTMFDHSSGRRVFWDYDPEYRFAREVQPEIRANIDFIRGWYAFIHGHFHYAKYAELLPDAVFVTCVRHPVARAVSHFQHVAALREDGDWRIPLIAAGRMDVVDFLRSDENIRQATAVHLAGRDLADYGFVFVTERLQAGIDRFSARFGFRFTTGVPQLNSAAARTDRPAPPLVTDAQRQKLFQMMPEDVAIYARAVELFG